MKRFTILAIMALFLLGTVATASAVDLKASGSWRVSGNWWQNRDMVSTDEDADDNFNVKQRARTQFEFIANENLKGVLYTEIGDFYWGNGAGEVSGDSSDAIEVKSAYLDFIIPNTEVNIKAGLQGLALPGFVGGSPLFDDDVAGITFNAPITDMVGVTGGWARLQDNEIGGSGDVENDKYAYNANSTTDDSGDNVDLAFLAVPLTFDGLQFVPYFGYVWAGKAGQTDPWDGISNHQDWMTDVYGAAKNATGDYKATGDASAWYFGIPVQVSMFDPLVVSADVHYGKMTIDEGDDVTGGEDVEIEGWLADLAVEYKMDMMTPMVFASYSTGLDEDDYEDGEFGIYPAIDGCWTVDTMLTDNSALGQDLELYQPVSMWTVGARLKDISFVEDLSHEVGIIYARGTSDNKVANFAGADGDVHLLNEDESLWAADFTTEYMIYENLAAIAELGYAKYSADFEDSSVDEDDFEDSVYKGVIGLKYDF